MVGSLLCLTAIPMYAETQNTLIVDAFVACREWVWAPTADFEVPGFNKATVALDYEGGIDLIFRDSGYAATFSAEFRDVGTDGYESFGSDCYLSAYSFEHPDLTPIQDAAIQISEIRPRLLRNGEYIEVPDPFGEMRDDPLMLDTEVYRLCDEEVQFLVHLQPPGSEGDRDWDFRVSLVSPMDPADSPDYIQLCSVN